MLEDGVVENLSQTTTEEMKKIFEKHSKKHKKH